MNKQETYYEKTMNMLIAVYVDLYQNIFIQNENDRFFKDYQKEIEEFFEEIKKGIEPDKAVENLSKKVGNAIKNYTLNTPHSIQTLPKVYDVSMRNENLKKWILNGYFAMVKHGGIGYLIFRHLNKNSRDTIKKICSNKNDTNIALFNASIDTFFQESDVSELDIVKNTRQYIIDLKKEMNDQCDNILNINKNIMGLVSSVSSTTRTSISPQSTIIFLLKQKIALAYDENGNLLVMDLLSPLLLETINSRKYCIREMSEQKDVMVVGPERETDKASDESSKCNNDNNKCKYKEDNIYMIDEDLAKERDAEIELMKKKMEAKRKKDEIIKQISKSFKKTIKEGPADNISF